MPLTSRVSDKNKTSMLYPTGPPSTPSSSPLITPPPPVSSLLKPFIQLVL